MISLLNFEVGGNYLVLSERPKFKLILKSPMFVYDSQPASRILSFTVPVLENELIFKSANCINNRGAVNTYNCNVYLANNLWKVGKIDVLKGSETQYEIQVRLDKSYYAEYSDKNMRTFEFKKNNTGYRFFYKNCERYEYLIDPITYSTTHYLNLTLANGLEVHTVNTSLNQTTPVSMDLREVFIDKMVNNLNAVFETTRWFGVKLAFNRIAVCYAGPHSGIASYTSNMYFSLFPIQWNGSPEPSKSVRDIYPDYRDTNKEFVFFPMINEGYYGKDLVEMGSQPDELVPLKIKYVNPMWPSHVITESHPLSAYYLAPTTPFPTVYQTLLNIASEMGLSVEDYLFDSEMKTLCLYSTIDISERIKVVYPGLIGTYIFNTARYFKLADALPNVTLSEFLVQLGNPFCTVYDFDSFRNRMRIMPRKTVLATPADKDWSSKVLSKRVREYTKFDPMLKFEFDPGDSKPGDLLKDKEQLTIKTGGLTFDILNSIVENDTKVIRRVAVDNKYYNSVPYVSGSNIWQEFAEDLYDFVPADRSADSKDEIIIKATPLFSAHDVIGKPTSVSTNNYVAVMPIANQIGRSTRTPALNEHHQIRMVFLRGMKKIYLKSSSGILSESAHEYPYASYLRWFPYDASMMGNYSLCFGNDGGLWSRWWYDWLVFLRNSIPTSFVVNLDVSDLFELDILLQKIIDNQEVLVDEIELDIDGANLAPAVIKSFVRKPAYTEDVA